MLKVKDLLAHKGRNVWSVSSRETAYYALELMAEKDIGALMVVDEGKFVGIFSERDYARKVILHGKSSRETPVAELMTKDVYSIETEKSVEECMALMTAVHCRHMPVLENHRLIGVVTVGDIVKAIISHQKLRISDLESYITGNEFLEIDDH
jgi:CBS domain-containing protein